MVGWVRGRRGLFPVPERAALEPLRQRWFLVVLGLGVVLRALAMLGYRPALWFPDSYTYVVTAMRPRPDLVRPAGYSMFLRLLEPLHSFALVAGVQHLLGLLTGVMVYLTARRLRAPAWAATLACVPVLLDAYQIELEHLLVSDTLFTTLVVAAVCLAVREPGSQRGRMAGACAIGLLVAAATLTRTVGLPLVALLGAWLLYRQRGRVAVAAVTLAAAALPILGYGVWFHATTGRIGLVGANGAFLYAKTMTFADCAVMRPSAELAVLCDPRPPASRPPSQEYLWGQDSPLVRLPGITFTRETDALAGEFASLAIRSQPLDYLGSVLTELGRSFTLDRPVYPDQEIYDHYLFPAATPEPPGRYPALVGASFARLYERGPIETEVVEPYAGWMRAYQGVAALPGAALLVILLLPPVVAGVRRARSAGSVPVVWALPWATAVTLLVMPAAVAEFDYRYVLPAVPLACLAAAFAASKPSFSNIPRNVRI
ncbi:phospholipid carrier-dependent glycosyltransferase [Streptosporangium sp. NPDC020145]|uniref:Phospholipid carrier-dependent glycosyltransferase n=1 Tax=Streptosporangium jomthongense TaxID=1193683 RepID=A0ABV8F7N5_9ACTN